MGENDGNEMTASAAAVAVGAEKLSAKPTPSEGKKKDKKTVATPEVSPHVTGRILHVEIGADGVEFAIKGKKGKAETFSLKGMDSAIIPAATALLSVLLESKNKLRVQYKTAGENRTVSKMRAQG